MTDFTAQLAPLRSLSLFGRVASTLRAIMLKRAEWRSAAEIARLSDHMLDDIGLTRADAQREAEMGTSLSANMQYRSPRMYL